MSKQLHDQFKDVPFRNVSPMAMPRPNYAIEIHSGCFFN